MDTNTGAIMLGWAVGKFVALKNGNIKDFCMYNAIPMAIVTYLGKDGEQSATIFNLLFLAGYLYFGYIA